LQEVQVGASISTQEDSLTFNKLPVTTDVPMVEANGGIAIKNNEELMDLRANNVKLQSFLDALVAQYYQ